MHAAFQRTIDALASVLLPAPCRICDRPLVNASRIPICEACLGSFVRVGEAVCPCCGRPQPASAARQSPPAATGSENEPSRLCRLCRVKTFAFQHARSWAVYDATLTAAVMLLKYEEVTRLGEWFAQRLTEVYGKTQASDAEGWRPDVIVPVPLHRERQRERGYNQVEMIARPLAKRLGLPMRAHLIARIKPRPARLVLSRSEHWESVRGAYSTPEGLRVDKARILLVDDVMTTGATLDACARALKKAGAAEIVALTVARVVPKWAGA